MHVVDAIADHTFFTGKPEIHCWTEGPFNKKEGMNKFLALLDVTFRRDTDTGSAKIDKFGTLIDRKQREIVEFYYSL